MEVGELISLYRKQVGMTIDELTSTSGVPKGTLNKIIGGTTKAPTLDNMKSIARALGKTLADFDDTSNATKNSPSAAEAEPGEDVSVMFDKLNDFLVSEGFIRDGDDLTDRQAEILLAVCRIINAAF